MSYQSEISIIRDITVEDVIRISTKYVPSKYRHAPWLHPELNHGKGLLNTDDALCCYMAAYGEMHMVKCRSVLRNLPFDEFVNIEVVDWGCGQGMGAICMAEMLRDRNKLHSLRKVTLIEPSCKALARAKFNVEIFTNGVARIIPINKYLPSISGSSESNVDGISYDYKTVVHIFSNILDIEEVDIVKVAKLLPYPETKQYIVCMGPKNKNSNRIDVFAQLFAQEKFLVEIDSARFGITKTNRYFGCNAKAFEYNNQILDYEKIQHLSKTITTSTVYDDYDIELAKINDLINPNAEAFVRMLYSYVNNYGDLIYFNTDIEGHKVDVIILRPQTGIFLFQVFDYNITNYRIVNQELPAEEQSEKLKEYQNLYASKCLAADNNDKISLPTTVLKHIKESLIKLNLEHISQERLVNKNYWSIVHSVGFFPHNTTSEINEYFKEIDHPNEYLLGADTTPQSLNKLLLKIGYFTSRNIFTNACKQDFIKVISPGWHSYREGKPITLTPTQKTLSLSEAGVKRKIKGIAGSGKTEVMIHRAVNAQMRTGKKVLILTYNLSLRNYIRSRLAQVRADFAWNNFYITNYHQFIRGAANSLNVNIVLHSFEDEKLFEHISNQTPRYSAIFIDEIQDYKPSWLSIINKYFLTEGGELVVFGDPKQRIYPYCDIDNQGDVRIGVIPGQWNGSLERKMRFSNTQLSDLADRFLQKYIDTTKELNRPSGQQQLDFSNITYLNLTSPSIPVLVRRIVDLLQHSNVDMNGDFIILAQTHTFIRSFEYEYRKLFPQTRVHSTSETQEEYDMLLNERYHSAEDIRFKEALKDIQRAKKQYFSMNVDGLKLSTIHSYKGWDAENVLLIIESHVGSEFLSPQNIYTGITRARNKVLIVNLGTNLYHDCFEQYIIR